MSHRPHIQDVVDLLIEHLFRQPKGGNLAAHEAAAGVLFVENMQLIAQWRQVTGHRQRCRTGSHQSDLLAVARRTARRHTLLNTFFVAIVRSHALEPADGHRLFLHATAAAGGLAGPVAGATENAREDVGFPVDHVGIVVAALSDQPDVLRHRRVRRAGVLTIDDLVKEFGILDIGWFQSLPPGACLGRRNYPCHRYSGR